MALHAPSLSFSNSFSGSVTTPMSMAAGQELVLATHQIQVNARSDAYIMVTKTHNVLSTFSDKISFVLRYDNDPNGDIGPGEVQCIENVVSRFSPMEDKHDLDRGVRTLSLVVFADADIDISDTLTFGVAISYLVAPKAF